MSNQYPPQQQYSAQPQQYPPQTSQYPPYNAQAQQYPAQSQQYGNRQYAPTQPQQYNQQSQYPPQQQQQQQYPPTQYNQQPPSQPPYQQYNNTSAPPQQQSRTQPTHSKSAVATQQKPVQQPTKSTQPPSKPSNSVKRPSPNSKVDSNKKSKPTVTPIDTRPKIKSQFIVDFEYLNCIPDIPFEPKLLKLHYDDSFVTRHCLIDFDDTTKPTIHSDILLNTGIDFIDTEQYNRPSSVKYGAIDPADLAMFDGNLLNINTILTGDSKSGVIQQLPSNKALIQQNTYNWLKKDMYLTNNLNVPTNTRIVAADSSVFRSNAVNTDPSDMDAVKQQQIQLIEQTFADAQQKPVHPTKKHLLVKNIQYIYPSDDLTANDSENTESDTTAPYTWIEFDVDPLRKYHETTNSEQTTSDNIPTATDLLIQSYTDNTNENTIHHGLYLHDNTKLPDTIQNIQNDTIQSKQHYEWTREYTSIPAPAVQHNNNYYFVFTNDKIYYNQYKQRMRVSKRSVDRKHAEIVLNEIAQRPASIDILNVSDINTEIDIGELNEQINNSEENFETVDDTNEPHDEDMNDNADHEQVQDHNDNNDTAEIGTPEQQNDEEDEGEASME